MSIQSHLLTVLINSSEKAACIARLCKTEGKLFDLLIEEKPSIFKNNACIQDFKTLADVIIQEMVRNDIHKEFPALSNRVFGEESNKFTNTLGETITVEMKGNVHETSTLLENVLAGDRHTATILAETMHCNSALKFDEIAIEKFEGCSLERLAIWIDPIDGTSEYIHGKDSEVGNDMLARKGLQCVTILIGVFDIQTGHPVLGVITKPFGLKEGNSWSSKHFWSHLKPNIDLNMTQSCPARPVVVISSNESQPVRDALQKEFEVIPVSGAGYKCLSIVQDLSHAYISSQPSTYQWDTCAPHAILLSLGGGIVDYSYTLSLDALEEEVVQIKYNSDPHQGKSRGSSPYRNQGGIIAYKDFNILLRIFNVLKNN